LQFSLLADSDINNSTIAWFVNGAKFKEGKFGTDGADRILPAETVNGVTALFINNQIFATVTPETDGATGKPAQSDTIIVQNAIPIVKNVKVAPSNPRNAQNLVLSFTFSDNDLLFLNDGSQSNQSTVKWYRSNRASNFAFAEVTEFRNVSVIPSSATSTGDQWKAIVTPFDGLDEGTPVESNAVNIS
jgi:hypothetical protein